MYIQYIHVHVYLSLSPLYLSYAGLLPPFVCTFVCMIALCITFACYQVLSVCTCTFLVACMWFVKKLFKRLNIYILLFIAVNKD